MKFHKRHFVKQKRFYVKPATKKDRICCLCRGHVETNMVFKAFMRLRSKTTGPQLPQQSINEDVNDESSNGNQYKIYSRLTELVEDTLCPKEQNEKYHKPCCVKQECEKCGIGNLKLIEAELSDSNYGDKVKWSRYKYITIE